MKRQFIAAALHTTTPDGGLGKPLGIVESSCPTG
jgi:hypothetical protein